jgi:hypothetical protein
VSARFTDVGIAAIFDQMALFEAEDKVGSHLATDDELLAIGAALVDGSVRKPGRRRHRYNA